MNQPDIGIPPPHALGRDPWLVMGILNVTPDSFYDGGRYQGAEAAIARAREMAAAGAGIIDVGGESTRPGAERVTLDEELFRVIPVIEAIASDPGVPVSIDTSKSEVAEAALKAGAAMINDITALRGDERMVEVAARHGCPVCLMHMQGDPVNMQKDPRYDDVVDEIIQFFRERIEWAVERGVRRENIILDPGIGFGKKLEHNLAIIRNFESFQALNQPLMIGASRKSFIGMIMEDAVSGDRLPGTIATNVLAYQNGARVFRVHDVAGNCQAIKVTAAVNAEPKQRRR
ncbi:MAG: dihydropteroate synthase [Thermoleophilia bacterium]